MVAMEGDPGGDTPANDAVPECVEKLDAVALTSPSADAAELGCGGAVSVVCTPFLSFVHDDVVDWGEARVGEVQRAWQPRATAEGWIGAVGVEWPCVRFAFVG